MKVFSLIALVLLLTTGALAQDSSNDLNPRDLAILKMGWHKDAVRDRLDTDPNGDVFASNDAYWDNIRAKRSAAIENNIRVAGGQTQMIRADEAAQPKPVPTPRSSDIYSYTIKVKNTGSKTIRSLTWDYVFIESGTGAELGRHQYISKVTIQPGKSQNLVGASGSSPIQVVNAKKSDNNSKITTTERVEINRVEYDDGSVWLRPSR